MDILFDSTAITEKKKMHYNEFMLEIHKEEHRVNKQLKGASEDTIAVVGKAFC